ncbi:hypothetical protein [Aciditerrimonas ferrireducens]|uniref:hypothetical protein n=1 Tax=Aciditerrimonas ferrireducens TaxID=667306 RepID=UPI00200489A1|nr:hypothetical protein [Aciditerrimonas ferrireducens]MCK4177702.1 hypothetical protein [Aciditerrimonas ferrireducens]
MPVALARTLLFVVGSVVDAVAVPDWDEEVPLWAPWAPDGAGGTVGVVGVGAGGHEPYPNA